MFMIFVVGRAVRSAHSLTMEGRISPVTADFGFLLDRILLDTSGNGLLCVERSSLANRLKSADILPM